MAQATTRRRNTRAGDATGRKDEELRVERDAELARRSEEITLAEAAESQRRDEVVDMTGKSAPAVVVMDDDDDDEPLPDEELVARAVESDDPVLKRLARRFMHYKKTAEQDVIDQGITVLGDETAIIRVAEDIEMMTFGAGNHLSFKAGQRYRVPEALANHLEEKGYVWH